MQDQLHRISTIDRLMKIPVALQSLLMDSFKYQICQTAPICPIIFAAAHLLFINIICETCVNTCYRREDGISRNSPQCSTERALPVTIRLHGLDDFLKAIKPLIDEPQSSNMDE